MGFPKTSLGQISDIFSGFAFRSKDLEHGGIPIIKIANIQNRIINKDCNDHLPKEKVQSKLMRYALQENDFLIAMTGAGSVGKSGKMWNVDRLFFVNQRVGIVRPDTEKCNPDYLFYVVSQENFERWLYSLGIGAGQPNISSSDIASLEIPVPPIHIQTIIANILRTFDNLIENSHRRIQLLEEMTRTIYREWFVHFRFPGHEDVEMIDSELGEIPEGWAVVSVGDLYDTTSGGTPSRKVEEYFGGKIPWVKTRELENRFILSTEENITELGLRKSSAKIFPENTILIAMYGATIGQTGILSQPSATNQACCALLPRYGYFDHSYIFLFLQESYDHLMTLRAGAAQQNINQQVIRELRILKPQERVIQHYARISNTLLENIKMLQIQNVLIIRIREFLLPKLVSGQIDVSDLEIEIP